MVSGDEPAATVVGRWLRDRALVTPTRTAIDFLDTPTTYAELDARSERLAAGLLARGLRRGDRVATLSGNRPEHVEVLFACAKAGLILQPTNWRLAPAEIAYQIDHAEPAVLLAHDDHAELARGALDEATHRPDVIALDRGPLDAIGDDGGGDARAATVADDDPLLLVYTSGTTGRPKGALLTHANCFWTNLSLDRTIDVTSTDVVLQVLPQFHVGGWNVQPLLAWWKGATVVLEPEFDPARVLALIQRKRVTTMMGVPATYLFLAEEEGFRDADLSSLRQMVVGGAPMPEDQIRLYLDRDVSLCQGYGLTEASPNVLGLPSEDVAEKVGYAGKPYLHVEVALRDVDTGETIDGPGIGELLVRGPNVFAGYWRDPDATAETIVDGWLRTGDVAERDEDGYYRIRDRTKDMYISGGENVYPAEVEAVISAMPQVVEAAVVGVPDDRWGEVGMAAVVVRAGASVTADEVRAFVGERSARFKVPRHVRFVDALPRNAVGKVVKGDIRSDLDPGEGDA